MLALGRARKWLYTSHGQRRRNQFFISRRKIDNFLFLDSCFLFFSSILLPFSPPSYLLRKLLHFQEATSSFVRWEAERNTRKQSKNLKWCYNLWSVRDYNHTNFFPQEKSLFVRGSGGWRAGLLKKLMSSLRWQWGRQWREKLIFVEIKQKRLFCCSCESRAVNLFRRTSTIGRLNGTRKIIIMWSLTKGIKSFLKGLRISFVGIEDLWSQDYAVEKRNIFESGSGWFKNLLWIHTFG